MLDILTRAVIKNQDLRITKLFDENDDVIDHLYRVPCPLTDGRINLRGYDQPIESNIPCRHHKIPFSALKSHFRHYHHVSDAFAQDLFD
ncbi:unnamed protein product [Rotaria sordida]|uniref:Uncharacterized protein n=1 Tax=Rotaria sordida TaxID=392033 RepID=A0A819MS88_9BILA|nr:unnamed protein product [Rotaria sordida]CAF1245158.1 unnamed protein product [Rotaria sordida]CAF1526936.1 unnamed protein product [Rotaria sordida]CAF3983838.1 unnamed protein product [Rotaria sordida]